jgi:hypothetical protein
MTKRNLLLPVVLSILIVGGIGLRLLTGGPDRPRAAQWKQVEEAMSKGLPKTAIERLEPIIAAALKDKAYPEAIKAIARKISLEGNIQGNKPEEKITRLRAEIAKAPAEMVPAMDAILANWYWHYFEQHRFRFLQRTATAVPPGNDFTTWDLPRILAEIDHQFTKALSADKTLKATPIGTYDDLLEKGSVPDSYRPTLYDFLAHNALAFYSAAEQAGAKAEDTFELPADSPIFAAPTDFLRWRPATTDAQSRTLKAVRLYQDLLRFHQGDKDPSAFLDTDLARLRFGQNRAFGEDKSTRYKAALKRFAKRWSNHEASALALFQWAGVLHLEGEWVEARRLALQGSKAFPNSVGGKLCYNLANEIEAPAATVSTERVWTDPWPEIQVRYRNLTKIHFRAIAYDIEKHLAASAGRPEELTDKERKALLKRKPVRQWSADLPPTPDFKERLHKLPAPQDLPAGSYYLIASHDPGFREKDNLVTFTTFWVSRLALVMRQRQGEGLLEGFVLNAASGLPLPGAEVKAWYRTNEGKRVAVPATRSDGNGLFRFRTVNNTQGYLVLAWHQGQTLASLQDFYAHQQDIKPRPYEQTVFFTDRALYRPGQTIQYKGVCMSVDTEKDDYKVIAGRPVTVLFLDPNNKEIARQQHRTNDYGSLSGSFTAPRDRLMGQMSIKVDGDPRGAAHFNVEEYKRPKFQVTLEKPKTAAKLNGLVNVQGKATAYTGAAVDGAKVSYRVVRQVRYPVWWTARFWWRQPRQDSQEIAHGTATTGVDGAFQVEFTARPDPAVLAKDEPIFRYAVSADVTDSAGETRSGQVEVNVGFTALQAEMEAAEWQTKDKAVEVKVRTTTLDAEGQKALGAVKVYHLRQPEKVRRGPLQNPNQWFIAADDKEPEADPSNPNSWPLGKVAGEAQLSTDAKGDAKLSFKLEPGAYRALLETQDRFGKKVTARLPLQVLDPTAKKLAIKVPSLVASPSWKLEPGGDFTALWGTGYGEGSAFIEIEHRRKPLQAFWTQPGQTQVLIKQAITEAQRGGFTLRVTMVRENRAYLESRQVEVPWSNKELKLRWEHFVSKLTPGQKETWTAVITGPDAKKAVAEMVAALYDESLDAYLPHDWPQGFGVFRHDWSHLNSWLENQVQELQHLRGTRPIPTKKVQWTYRAFPEDIAVNFWGYEAVLGRDFEDGRLGATFFSRTAEPAALATGIYAKMDKAMPAAGLGGVGFGGGGFAGGMPQVPPPAPPAGVPGPDLSKVSARKNLNETAFFFPHLLSDKDGEVRLQFTMPEALTQWKLLGFAHDKDLRAGYLTGKAVTSRELMVQPHPPRFLREGDLLDFTVKVSNQSDARQQGTVRLTLADARTGKSVDAALGNTSSELSFDVPAKESRSYAWRLKVPDEMGFLTYKAVASSGPLSDGEEGYLAVLSRRVLVTESLPLPIRGPQTRTFDFARLRQSGSSATLRHQSLTVQVASNPAWYAVLALPYLMEYPWECTEQTFNRLYANSLARHIAGSDPKIRQVFEQWKGTPALDSPLEKNQDLKAVMLEETPWVRQVQAESQARRNIGILFDQNRLDSETSRTLKQLADMQHADGAWPWFPGGPANDYITLYITTGFGRLRHLGAQVDTAPGVKALGRLDGWIDSVYQKIKPDQRKANHLTPTIALYLYGRSFFLKDQAVGAPHKEAVDYFLGQAKTHWLKLAHRQSQGHLALALFRFGERDTARAIMRSIKERAVTNEEMGMFWRDLELSWWWFRAPIETQALIIEAFDEVMNDAAAVEECKVWLLKQKQTQDWKTTKATADAVYALLLRGGRNLLASDALVEISLAGLPIRPEKVEAGTGFYEKRFAGPEVKAEQGQITLKKVDEGVAWGSVHWQYLEDVGKVTAYEGTPLKLKKALYTKVSSKKGPVLRPLNGDLKVGDELVVRLELRVDRDMEYVHLKDGRGSGTEPVNVLSQYRYQDGLAYYESTRDTASHFFIDYLPKGVYVFEYSTRIVHRGQYQTGMAQIQCMYAPEFNSHSESFVLTVR